MIATAALAAYLFTKADFSSSGRRKATIGVLDDHNARRPVVYKSGPFALRVRMSGARSEALFDPLRAK